MARQTDLDQQEWNEWEEFTWSMLQRFKKGRKKYGKKYFKRDNLTELQMELIDVANYAMMEFIKIEAMKNKNAMQTQTCNKT